MTLFFNTDGSKMFIEGEGGKIFTYNLNPNWDYTTAKWDGGPTNTDEQKKYYDKSERYELGDRYGDKSRKSSYKGI